MASNKDNTIFEQTSFLQGGNSPFIKELYLKYLENPNLIPESWKDFYRETRPNMVRGGIRGHQFDELCQEFDDRHAQMRGMLLTD